MALKLRVVRGKLLAVARHSARLVNRPSKVRHATTLAARLAEVGFISRGSLVAGYTSCGKDSCRCRNDPDQRHGPYWQWTRAVRGRTITRRLSARQAALYRQWISNQRALDRIASRMRQISRGAGEILLREERSGSASPRKARRP